jgi:hypothetical protein
MLARDKSATPMSQLSCGAVLPELLARKDRERGRGKARLQGEIDEKEGADWRGRPTAAALSGDSLRIARANLPSSARSLRGAIRFAEDRSALAQSSVEERRRVVSFLGNSFFRVFSFLSLCYSVGCDWGGRQNIFNSARFT